MLENGEELKKKKEKSNENKGKKREGHCMAASDSAADLSIYDEDDPGSRLGHSQRSDRSKSKRYR